MHDALDRARAVTSELGWVDSVAIAVLAIFLVRGMIHGFVWQLAALAGLVGGLLAATQLAPQLAPTLRTWFPSLKEEDSLDLVAAYFIVFFAVLLGAALLGKLLRGLIDRFHLASYDRLLGGMFGVIKAAVFVVLTISFLSLFDSLEPVLAKSRTARYSGQAIDRGGPLFPEEVKVHLRRALDSVEEVLTPDPGGLEEPSAGGDAPADASGAEDPERLDRSADSLPDPTRGDGPS